MADPKTNEVKKSEEWTYVGAGAEPPNVILFMNRQEFVRGKPVEVSDPMLLAKIQNNPSFRKGKVDPKELHDADEAAAKKVLEQRKVDAETQKTFDKEQARLAKGSK